AARETKVIAAIRRVSIKLGDSDERRSATWGRVWFLGRRSGSGRRVAGERRAGLLVFRLSGRTDHGAASAPKNEESRRRLYTGRRAVHERAVASSAGTRDPPDIERRRGQYSRRGAAHRRERKKGRAGRCAYSAGGR